MIIQSYNHNYTVLRSRRTSRQSTCYECVDYQNEGTPFDVIVLQSVSDRVKEYLATLEEYPNFHEVEECFQGSHKYYVVLVPPKGRRLNEKLHLEICGLAERTRIGKALMEHIILRNMPLYFLLEGLKKEHVWIDDSLDIHLQYELKDIENYEKATMTELGRRLDAWMKLLFPRECKSKNCTQLKEFRDFLKKGQFQSYMEVYDGYLLVYKHFMEMTEEEEEAQLPRWTHLVRESLEKIYQHYHILLGAALLLLLAGLLAGFIHYKQKEHEPMEEGFTYIGTVKIQKGEGAEESD